MYAAVYSIKRRLFSTFFHFRLFFSLLVRFYASTLPLPPDLEGKSPVMKWSPLLLALAGLAAAAPAKRQITGIPLGMIGILGIDTTFDYVVVGGGTAGLTIATRLAENPLSRWRSSRLVRSTSWVTPSSRLPQAVIRPS
jgi:hypothetical protein